MLAEGFIILAINTKIQIAALLYSNHWFNTSFLWNWKVSGNQLNEKPIILYSESYTVTGDDFPKTFGTVLW